MRILRWNRPDSSIKMNPIYLLKRPNSFYDNTRFAVILPQFIGLMPLSKIGKNTQKVEFKYCSFGFLYSLFQIGSTLAGGVVCVLHMIKYGFVIEKTVFTGFYIFNTMTSIYFVYLARKWQSVIDEYYHVEDSIKGYPSKSNIKKINVWMTTVFMIIGLTEHMLFIFYHLHNSWECDNYQAHPAKTYFGAAFPQWFTLVDYSHWAAAIVEFSNFSATFTWTFTDLFIILISISLTDKFNQISNRIEQTKNPPSQFWKEIRENYCKVSSLTNKVDIRIAGLVLISFLNNIFVLCVQLYNSIKERDSNIEIAYFFFSFGYVLFRLVGVSLYSAKLNEAARKPLNYLYAIPTESYTTDVSRLITQINYLPNGITGHGFFLITKNFLLQAAAAVITLELMIFEFSPVKTNTTSLVQQKICIK